MMGSLISSFLPSSFFLKEFNTPGEVVKHAENDVCPLFWENTEGTQCFNGNFQCSEWPVFHMDAGF